MAGYEIVAEARIDFDNEQVSPEVAKEHVKEMIESGEISPELSVEWGEE